MPEKTEKPILFQGDMVRAILEGRKTVTRRVIKPQPPADFNFLPDLVFTRSERFTWSNLTMEQVKRNCCGEWFTAKCPYDAEQLWVRETFWYNGMGVKGPVCCHYRATYDGFFPVDKVSWKWKPSIFMPRWASRLQLRVKSVRAERLQEITIEDAFAEGAINYKRGDGPWNDPHAIPTFRDLWDSINGKPRKDGVDISWTANPWVWRTEFERAK